VYFINFICCIMRMVTPKIVAFLGLCIMGIVAL
jgi:hypothetical protein